MDKRRTIHLPAERHQQLREIATARGHSTITELLEALIKRELTELALDEEIGPPGPFRIACDGQNRVMLTITGLPPICLTLKQAKEFLIHIRDTIQNRRRTRFTLKGEWIGLTIDFGRRGRGYEISVGQPVGKQANGLPRWEWHNRGLTNGLVIELIDRLGDFLSKLE